MNEVEKLDEYTRRDSFRFHSARLFAAIVDAINAGTEIHLAEISEAIRWAAQTVVQAYYRPYDVDEQKDAYWQAANDLIKAVKEEKAGAAREALARRTTEWKPSLPLRVYVDGRLIEIREVKGEA